MRIKLFIMAAMALAVGCSQGPEELPSDLPNPGDDTNIDSLHRPVPQDTDSMIDPRTGKPKTGETDTI